MFWPLMKDCITKEDKAAMIEFIQTTSRFTNGPRVRQFEESWSRWLGVSNSLFVSSGSTANFLLVAAVKEHHKLQAGDKVLVPTMTWVTNVSPIIQLGLTPVFCDVDPTHFGFDKRHMRYLSQKHPDIKLVFVSHLFGFAAPVREYQSIVPKAVFIEDVCESHGAMDGQQKVGSFCTGSTFSSYFGHHMTTVEGGFVSTNEPELYELMRAKRSHGLARETSPQRFKKFQEQYPDVHKQFLFITDGYNFRNSELYAVLGLSQLNRLDANNEKRRKNLRRFLDICRLYDAFELDYKCEGNSSFCLPFRVKDHQTRIKLETYLNQNGVETRPLCSGNLLKQPFLREYRLDIPWAPNIDRLHRNGFFIGNNHMITDQDFERLESILKNFFAQTQPRFS